MLVDKKFTIKVVYDKLYMSEREISKLGEVIKKKCKCEIQRLSKYGTFILAVEGSRAEVEKMTKDLQTLDKGIKRAVRFHQDIHHFHTYKSDKIIVKYT